MEEPAPGHEATAGEEHGTDRASGRSSRRVLISPGTLRDYTYIAANIRPEDWAEISCQLPDGIGMQEAAAITVANSECWTAFLDGQPVAAFGTSVMTVSVLSLWAWGTKRLPRAAPAITRFVVGELVPQWIERGITRVEARSIGGHIEAHRWMRNAGARSQPCPEWGKGGENFVLFYWTRQGWLSRSAQTEKR